MAKHSCGAGPPGARTKRSRNRQEPEPVGVGTARSQNRQEPELLGAGTAGAVPYFTTFDFSRKKSKCRSRRKSKPGGDHKTRLAPQQGNTNKLISCLIITTCNNHFLAKSTTNTAQRIKFICCCTECTVCTSVYRMHTVIQGKTADWKIENIYILFYVFIRREYELIHIL